MAKELPYFKFEPSEWLVGDIMDFSYTHQGVFIHICSLYWLKLGEVTYASALRKVSDRNEVALRELIHAEIIHEEEGYLRIHFLDEQLNDFNKIASKNRENALKRWNKADNNATALPSDTDRNAIREDKKREEDKREEKRTIVFPFDSKEFLKSWDQWKVYKKKEFNFSFKSQVSEQAALKKLAELSGGAEQVSINIIMQSIENGWKGFFELKNNRQNGGQKGFTNFAAAQLANDADYKRL